MNKTAAMIGAGLIGRSWAMVFARAGWSVTLYDAVPAQLAHAREYIAESLVEQQAGGLCDVNPSRKMSSRKMSSRAQRGICCCVESIRSEQQIPRRCRSSQ